MKAKKKGPAVVVDAAAVQEECSKLTERKQLLLRENAELQQLVGTAEGNNAQASATVSRALDRHAAELEHLRAATQHKEALHLGLRELLDELGVADGTAAVATGAAGANGEAGVDGAAAPPPRSPETKDSVPLQSVVDMLQARVLRV